MKIVVDANTRVERGICPPMPQVITLPLTVDGDRKSGWCIYLTHSAFASSQPTKGELMDLAREVARRVGEQP